MLHLSGYDAKNTTQTQEKPDEIILDFSQPRYPNKVYTPTITSKWADTGEAYSHLSERGAASYFMDIEYVTLDGIEYTRFRKFYYKWESLDIDIRHQRWYFSDIKMPGYKVFPAFIDKNGAEHKYLYISCPIVSGGNRTYTQILADAASRGDGVEALNIYALGMYQLRTLVLRASVWNGSYIQGGQNVDYVLGANKGNAFYVGQQWGATLGTTNGQLVFVDGMFTNASKQLVAWDMDGNRQEVTIGWNWPTGTYTSAIRHSELVSPCCIIPAAAAATAVSNMAMNTDCVAAAANGLCKGLGVFRYNVNSAKTASTWLGLKTIRFGD